MIGSLGMLRLAWSDGGAGGELWAGWELTNFATQPLPTDRGHRGIAHFMSSRVF